MFRFQPNLKSVIVNINVFICKLLTVRFLSVLVVAFYMNLVMIQCHSDKMTALISIMSQKINKVLEDNRVLLLPLPGSVQCNGLI